MRVIRQMVFHEAHARWSLMSNEPYADVEGLFFAAAPDLERSSQGQRDRAKMDRPWMRVRLSRKRRQMEIARVVRRDGVPGEWVVKTFPIGMREGSWRLVSRDGPESEEERGMTETLVFLRLCERMEDAGGQCLKIM
jgi:hypothetical protein